MENSNSNKNKPNKTKKEGGKKEKKVGRNKEGKAKKKNKETKPSTSNTYDSITLASNSDLSDFDSDSVSGYEIDSEMEIDLHTLMKGMKRKKGRKGDKEGEESSSDELLPSKIQKDNNPIVETIVDLKPIGIPIKTPMEKLTSFVLALPMPQEKRTTIERLVNDATDYIQREHKFTIEASRRYAYQNKELRAKVDRLEAEMKKVKEGQSGNPLEEKLNQLSAKLDSFISERSSCAKEAPVSKPLLYSDIIKTNKSTKRIAKKAEIKKAKPVAAIYPATGSKIENSEEMKRALTEWVNPTEQRIRIRNLRKIRNSGILIETESRKDLEQVLQNSKLKEKAVIGSIPKRKPKMIIFGVPSKTSEEELKEAIEKQNLELSSSEKPEEEFKLLFKTGKKDKEITNWVAEVSPKTRKILLARNRVFIGFNAHGIKDYIAASRCFKCQAFGHVAKYCKAKIDTCGHCGDDGHTYKECTKRKEKGTCINCKRAGKTANHGLKDKNCPAYKHAIETILSRIDFGSDEVT